jgi:hypothetical protein
MIRDKMIRDKMTFNRMSFGVFKMLLTFGPKDIRQINLTNFVLEKCHLQE